MDFLSVSNKDYIWSQTGLQVTLAQITLADLDGFSRGGRREMYRWERLKKGVIWPSG